MATKSLTFDIFGRDRSASKAIRGVGNEVDRTGGRFSAFKGIAGVALAAVGAAAATFAVDSVKAFAEAEEAQLGLQSTLDRFPRLADTNIEKLNELNEALMNKTRFDDDAIASGQAILGQFELTGSQLETLTPLMLDYAQKTGQDIPTAAEALGKAILGQGRALKDIGIDFQDTGTAAGNFDQLVGALRGQVGGFAEESAGTTLGKLDQLENKFGELQEAVGEELQEPLGNVLDLLNEPGTIDGVAQAVGDVATELSNVKNMVEDIQALGDWFERGGLANESTRDQLDDKLIESGGLVGGMVSWSRDMEQVINDFFGGITEDQNTWASDFNTGWQNAWGSAQSSTDEGMSGVRGGMGGGLSGMSGDMSVFEQATRGQWSGMWGAVDGDTRTGMGSVNSSAGVGIGAIGGTLAGMSPIAGGAFMAAWLAAQAATSTGWGGVDGATRGGMGTVGSTLGGFRGVVEGPFSGASGWLISAGGNIVRGLVQGIAGMVGSAAQAAATLAQNVVAGAKAALGIQSPSRVFREIGEFVGQGFELGINDEMPSVQASINAMVAAPSAQAGGGGIAVHVTNTSGVSLRDLVQIEIEANGRREKVALESGRRK